MNDRTFLKILISLIGVCLLLTVAHLIWAVWAYQHSSIIQFIAKELW